MANGWTQEELASELGWAVQNLGRLEQGRIDPRHSTIMAVAAALQLGDPGEILRPPSIKSPGPGRPRRN